MFQDTFIRLDKIILALLECRSLVLHHHSKDFFGEDDNFMENWAE